MCQSGPGTAFRGRSASIREGCPQLVVDLYCKNSKRVAILVGRWLAGEQESILFVTLTLGPRWEGFDFRGSVGQLVEWLRRHEFRGIALIGTQQRGASYLHLYLAAGDCGWARIQAYWLVWHKTRPREPCHKAKTAKL